MPKTTRVNQYIVTLTASNKGQAQITGFITLLLPIMLPKETTSKPSLSKKNRMRSHLIQCFERQKFTVLSIPHQTKVTSKKEQKQTNKQTFKLKIMCPSMCKIADSILIVYYSNLYY